MALQTSVSEEGARIGVEIDRRLGLLLADPGDARDRLYQAMRYSAVGGGKRLRPLLVCAAARLFRVDEIAALQVATAVELIHVYSLVHDDLPCMDDDELRRGKPTAHRAFDEATAVLSGDSMHALAFELLAAEGAIPDPFIRIDLVRELARAAGPAGMAGGQMMDMLADSLPFDLPSVTRLQQLKTGALIAFCVEAGCILGHVPQEGRTALRGYARDIGLAYQIADDLLDAEGSIGAMGKAARKDAGSGKATFVSQMGVERAREQADLLVRQAIAHLHGHGDEADLLRAIARYVVERDR